MAIFGESICPKCRERQWSITDNRYLKIYGHCWACDKKEWESKRLSLAEFEQREIKASKTK